MLHNAVRAMREAMQLTQAQLASRLYCSPQAVSDYELGRRRVPDGYLKAVAVLFAVNEPHDPTPAQALDMACEACEIHRARVAIMARRQIQRAA